MSEGWVHVLSQIRYVVRRCCSFFLFRVVSSSRLTQARDRIHGPEDQLAHLLVGPLGPHGRQDLHGAGLPEVEAHGFLLRQVNHRQQALC